MNDILKHLTRRKRVKDIGGDPVYTSPPVLAPAQPPPEDEYHTLKCYLGFQTGGNISLQQLRDGIAIEVAEAIDSHNNGIYFVPNNAASLQEIQVMDAYSFRKFKYEDDR